MTQRATLTHRADRSRSLRLAVSVRSDFAASSRIGQRERRRTPALRVYSLDSARTDITGAAERLKT